MFASLRDDSKPIIGASLHEICRTCLGQADENCVSMHEIPDWSGIGAKQIKAILEELTKCKIDDVSPQRICSICFGELQLVHTFLERCIEAEKRIKECRSSASNWSDVPASIEIVDVKTEFDASSDGYGDSHFDLDDAIGDRLGSDSDGVPEIDIQTNSGAGGSSADSKKNADVLKTSFDARQQDGIKEGSSTKATKATRTAKAAKSATTGKAAKSPKTTKPTKPAKTKDQTNAKRRKLDTSANSTEIDGVAEPQSYLCPACGLAFDSNTEFIKHSKAHEKDNQQLKFTCEFCKKQMRTNQEYKRHRNTHTREQKFICDMCGKHLSNRACLQLHFKYHMNIRKFKCQHCDCRFVTSREIKDHTRAKHVVKMIACTYENCAETFDSEHWLNIHLRLHQTNYQFRCDVCGIACVNQYRLKEHKRIHTGETKAPCPFCGKVLSRIQHLRRHIESFHSNNSETATKPSRLLPSMKKEDVTIE